MIKKLIVSFSFILALVCIFVFSAYAANDTVYVKSGGTGNGLTYQTPIGNLVKAFSLVGDNPCDVVIIGNFPITNGITLPDVKSDVTVKGVDGGKISLAANIEFEVNKNTNTYTFDLPFSITGSGPYFLFGGFNSMTFGNNFSVTKEVEGKFSFYGGVTAREKVGISNDIPFNITVNAGSFDVFAGGNYRGADYYLGAITAPITITINGGTFGTAGDYPTNSNNKNYDTFSVSGMSILADDATLNINGGVFHHPVYVQGRLYTVASNASLKCTEAASNRKYYAIDGDIKVNITGGTFNGGAVGAYYTQSTYTTLMRGNYTVKVTGGTFTKETLFDATQVKAYSGKSEKATIDYSVDNIVVKRFDKVNGVTKTYDEPIRVVFIGDSITEGAAQAEAKVNKLTDSYPSKFLAYCEAAGKEVIVGNFGVGASGFLPNTSRYYWNMLAFPMVTEETDPDIVFFAMGTNDANGVGGTHGAELEYEKRFNMILDMMTAYDTVDKVYITNAIYRVRSYSADLRMASILHPVQKRIAENYAKKDSRVQFVDLYGLTLGKAITDELFTDPNGVIHERLHPVHAGLDFMGKCCYEVAFKGIYKPATDYHLTEIYLSDNGTTNGKGTYDDPISFLPYACGIAAIDKEVTFYIKDTFTIPENATLPAAPSKLNIVGVSSSSTLVFKSNTLKLGTNTKFNNITLSATGSAYMFACYNSVEFTSSVKTTGSWHFYLGYNTYSIADPAGTNLFDTAVSASSAKNCTVTINGGSFINFGLGNKRMTSTSPFGTYSGSATLTVGKNASVGVGATTVGLVGQNYQSGNIKATLASWGASDIKEFSPLGSIDGEVTYEPASNVGKVNVVLSGISKPIDVMGDFDGNGTLGVGDMLLALGYVLNGFDASKTGEYFGDSLDNLREVLALVKRMS